MKKFYTTLAIVISMSSFAQTTAIPDNHFEQKLIELGFDDVLDGMVTTVNISSVTDLTVDNAEIKDLTGIGDFSSLVTLSVNNNYLTSLDLSRNLELTGVFCENNYIIDLRVNYLYGLIDLNCAYNNLTQLDLNDNLNLVILNCKYNELFELDLSHNQKLKYIYCNNTTLIDLDLSQNDKIIELDCSDNSLACLDLRNGNNKAINVFKANLNPALSCIEVDDPYWATENWTTIDGNIDDIVTFSEDCPENCELGIDEVSDQLSLKNPVKITDLMGRDIEFRSNTLMLLIFEDGRVIRTIVGE